MVEIFAVRIGQDEAATRTVGNEIKLSGPSNVYFGAGAPGIAFYEKSGADLRVTLLDGQEILVREFFVIGEAGEYSRLLDGGSGGEIEVTGLIAPEPFIPATDTPPAQVVVDDKADTATPIASAPEAKDGEIVVEVMGEGDAQPIDVSTGAGDGATSGGSGGTGMFGGFGLDKLLYFAAYTPAIVSMLDHESGGHSTPATTDTPPPEETAPGEAGGAGDGLVDSGAEPGAGAEVPPDSENGGSLLDLLASLLDGDSSTSLVADLFGAPDNSVGLDSFAADTLDPLGALLDDLQSTAHAT